MAVHCTEPFIITHPSFRYDLNNVERYVKYQTIVICFNPCHAELIRMPHPLLIFSQSDYFMGVVRWCEGVVYLTSPGCPTDTGLQLGKACYPCSR